MRRLLLLTGAVVFFDTLFFAALTPLLPHYVHALGIGKTGAGILAAAYPAGTLVGSIPSGVIAARAGVKPTVLVGLTIVAGCTIAFGLASSAWVLDVARFLQGTASAFSWTGALSWLVARSPRERRGEMIGSALAAAVGGALFGPVLGGVASVVGTGWTFGSVGVASLGLVGWAGATRSERPERPEQPGGPAAIVNAAFDRRIAVGCWFVVLPGLLFGTLGVLGSLRLSHLGLSGAAIGGVFLCGAVLEALVSLVVGRASDRHGPRRPILLGLAASSALAAALPWPGERFALAALVVCAAPAFGSFFTSGMTLVTHAAELRGLGYGYAFALINLAWAPGQALGAAGSAALAHATADAVPYLVLAGLCSLTLSRLWTTRASTGWMTRSGRASSGSSSPTTAAG